MSTAKGMAGITAAMGSLACVAALAVAWPAHGATPLRSYATEWNREAQGITTAQKEALITAILDQWQPAALRFGADAKTWRDSFGLQLSMLPGSKLAALSATPPANGFQGVVAAVSEPLRSAAEGRATVAKDLGQTTTDLVFVPINPCRIADTRSTSAIVSGAPRDFAYANPAGGTFTAQGGAGTNCGLGFAGGNGLLVPRAVAATVTIITPSGAGNLVIYPTGTAPGTTSALNYGAGAVLANTTVIVGAQGGVADFTVALNGPPHGANVAIDVIGYYYSPLATPLDCLTVQSTNNNKAQPPGATDQFGAACTAGYQITGGGCHFSNTDLTSATENTVVLNKCSRQFDTNTQLYLNGWFGQWTNNDPVKSFRFNVRAMCCRVPGH